MKYPEEAWTKKIEGEVVVTFIVDKNGNVTNVVALSGPDELRPEAVRVIQSSPRWKPAERDKQKVDSYKKQPLMFRLRVMN